MKQRKVPFSFQREYAALSNFAACPVTLDGQVFASVEHAYQGSKTLDMGMRQHIRRAESAATAKARGRRVTLRPDWEQVRDEIMLDLLTQKFGIGSFREILLHTGDEEITEWNYWGDVYWGVDITSGKGRNELGRMLMYIRNRIRHGSTES